MTSAKGCLPFASLYFHLEELLNTSYAFSKHSSWQYFEKAWRKTVFPTKNCYCSSFIPGYYIQLPAVKTKHILFSWLVFFSRFRQKTRENPSCWNPHHLNWRLRINKINKNPQKHAILFLKGPSTSEVTFYNRLIGLFKWFAPFQWLRFHFTLCKCRLYYKERWESSVAQLFLVKNERVNKIYRI